MWGLGRFWWGLQLELYVELPHDLCRPCTGICEGFLSSVRQTNIRSLCLGLDVCCWTALSGGTQMVDKITTPPTAVTRKKQLPDDDVFHLQAQTVRKHALLGDQLVGMLVAGKDPQCQC